MALLLLAPKLIYWRVELMIRPDIPSGICKARIKQKMLQKQYANILVCDTVKRTSIWGMYRVAAEWSWGPSTRPGLLKWMAGGWKESPATRTHRRTHGHTHKRRGGLSEERPPHRTQLPSYCCHSLSLSLSAHTNICVLSSIYCNNHVISSAITRQR